LFAPIGLRDLFLRLRDDLPVFAVHEAPVVAQGLVARVERVGEQRGVAGSRQAPDEQGEADETEEKAKKSGDAAKHGVSLIVGTRRDEVKIRAKLRRRSALPGGARGGLLEAVQDADQAREVVRAARRKFALFPGIRGEIEQ
jgi:hypothetical protein